MAQDMQTAKAKAQEEPQFSFNRYEILFLLGLIGLHQVIVTKMVVEYSSEHPESTTT